MMRSESRRGYAAGLKLALGAFLCLLRLSTALPGGVEKVVSRYCC